MRESTVERKLVGHIRETGGVCLKWVSPGFTGVPDRIVIMPGGKVIFVELKRPDLKDGRSVRQKRVAELLTRLGCTVIRLNNVEDIDEYL